MIDKVDSEIFNKKKITEEIDHLQELEKQYKKQLEQLDAIWTIYKGKKNDLESIVFEKYFIKGWKPKGIAVYAHCDLATVYRKIEKIESCEKMRKN